MITQSVRSIYIFLSSFKRQVDSLVVCMSTYISKTIRAGTTKFSYNVSYSEHNVYYKPNHLDWERTYV